MLVAEACIKVWIYLGFIVGFTRSSRPRFDASTDMRKVLVPADAEIDSVIFRLRATDEEPDFPLIFNITATVIPVVRVENLPCTLYNKVCQANVILTRRLSPGKFYDFLVVVRDSRGDNNSMQATISVTNGTTPRSKIFLHKPSLIMVPENAKPGTELDYLIVQSNPWSGKPVYIELWQPKDLFKIVQRQTERQTQGIITLIGELDFETQTMHTLTMYATDPYTEPAYDTRNIVGLQVVVVVQDIQDVPPIFTIAPPLTKINNTIQPGDTFLRVHAEDGDKGVPREVTYGLVSEGNPFTPFFHINETTGEISLARPLEEVAQITRIGTPLILTVVAEEVRHSWDDPPAQASVVELGILLGEPENNPPYFESDNYVAWLDENAQPGTTLQFSDAYSTKVKDDDIGKAGVFTLKLENNNGTFEINPIVAERSANFLITVRDNILLDYEVYKSLSYQIIAQEVGPATNLSASVPATVFLRDVNDNAPEFDEPLYEISLSENATANAKVVQVHATDKDTGIFGVIQYTRITGGASSAFVIDPNSGLITVSGKNTDLLDREKNEKLELLVEARDENGNGLKSEVPLIIHLLDVNDNAPIFEKEYYEFRLNSDMTNFTHPAFIKATDADAEPPNNEVRYEIIHGNYENKFYLDEITGQLFLREEIHKHRRIRQNEGQNLAFASKQVSSSFEKQFRDKARHFSSTESAMANWKENQTKRQVDSILSIRIKRTNENALFTITVRAYDLGVPLLSTTVQVRILPNVPNGARIVTFVIPGEHPNPNKTAETLATITGSRVTIQEIRPYVQLGNESPNNPGGKKSIIVARVEQSGSETLVDIEKIRESLAANGVGVISGMDGIMNPTYDQGESHSSEKNMMKIHMANVTNTQNEQVTTYKAENQILYWLLIILGLLLLLAIIIIILCCICPGCPFYMEPRKRRIHSSETLIVRSEGRPKRHVQRRHLKVMNGLWSKKKQAWSADNSRHSWQFNRRNTVMNYGLASLPGDVTRMYESKNGDALTSRHTESLHFRNESERTHRTEEVQKVTVEKGEREGGGKRRGQEEERVGRKEAEDVIRRQVDEKNIDETESRIYDMAEIGSVRRHEFDRGSDDYRKMYQKINQLPLDDYEERDECVREQHYYREGNAEVLRLVTRGQVEDNSPSRRPNIMLMDPQAYSYEMDEGKDILMQRFIQDQKLRRAQQEMHQNEHDIKDETMEYHLRKKKDILPPAPESEVILIPSSLDQRHFDHLRANLQHLILEHADYNYLPKADLQANQPQLNQITISRERKDEPNLMTTFTAGAANKPSDESKETMISHHPQYVTHDSELIKQNVLLTRLLLERENKAGSSVKVDVASHLETQSLPGQVAIGTQTGCTAATQTERRIRSRSDNEMSEDDSRLKTKWKLMKRYSNDDVKKIKSIWKRSPISEKSRSYVGIKIAARKKMAETREGRKVSLSPEVLQEISESLNGNEDVTFNNEDQFVEGEEDEDDDSDDYDDDEVNYKNGREQVRKKNALLYHRLYGFESKTKCLTNKDNVQVSTCSGESAEHHSKYRQRQDSERKIDVRRKMKTAAQSEPSFRVIGNGNSPNLKRVRKYDVKKQQTLVVERAIEKETSSGNGENVTRGKNKDKDYRRPVHRGTRESKMKCINSVEDTTSTPFLDTDKSDSKSISPVKSTIGTTSRKRFKHQDAVKVDSAGSELDDQMKKMHIRGPACDNSQEQKQSMSTTNLTKDKDLQSRIKSKSITDKRAKQKKQIPKESKSHMDDITHQVSEVREAVGYKKETNGSNSQLQEVTSLKDRTVKKHDEIIKINLQDVQINSISSEKVVFPKSSIHSEAKEMNENRQIGNIQQTVDQGHCAIRTIDKTKASIKTPLFDFDETKVDPEKEIREEITSNMTNRSENHYKSQYEGSQDFISCEQVEKGKESNYTKAEETLNLPMVEDHQEDVAGTLKDIKTSNDEKNTIQMQEFQHYPTKMILQKQHKIEETDSIAEQFDKNNVSQEDKSMVLTKRFSDDFIQFSPDTEKSVTEANGNTEMSESSGSVKEKKNVEERETVITDVNLTSVKEQFSDTFEDTDVQTELKETVESSSTLYEKDDVTPQKEVEEISDKKCKSFTIISPEVNRQMQMRKLERSANVYDDSATEFSGDNFRERDDSDSSDESDISNKTMLNNLSYNTTVEQHLDPNYKTQETDTKKIVIQENTEEVDKVFMKSEDAIEQDHVLDTQRNEEEERNGMNEITSHVVKSIQILKDVEKLQSIETEASKSGESHVNVVDDVGKVEQKHSPTDSSPPDHVKSLSPMKSLPRAPDKSSSKCATQQRSRKLSEPANGSLAKQQLLLSKSHEIKTIIQKSPVMTEKKPGLKKLVSPNRVKDKERSEAAEPMDEISQKGKEFKQVIRVVKMDRRRKAISGSVDAEKPKHQSEGPIEARSRYMAWYKEKREEMERKRREKNAVAEDGQVSRRDVAAGGKSSDDKEKTSGKATRLPHRRKIKPLVNNESEQLKQIVRQGRKMRRGRIEDPSVQIFAPEKPPRYPLPSSTPKHHLVQHSEYKYERMPVLPFYLHPPPAPHPSPENSPELPTVPERPPEDDIDSGIAVSLQGGTKLRHQQLLEKKSVFDIAYSEAAPTKLRSDSSTPPS